MGTATIPQLPQAIALTGAEQVEAVQSGASVRLTLAQIAQLGGPPGPQGPVGPQGPQGPSGIGFITQVAATVPSGATDAFAPVGYVPGVTNCLVLTPTDSSSLLQGLLSTGVQSGFSLLIINPSPTIPLGLANEAAATASNEFLCPFTGTVSLGAQSMAILTYVNSQWQISGDILPIGNLVLSPSGDTTGVTDTLYMQAMLTIIGSSLRLPIFASQRFTTANLTLQPGSFYFNSSVGDLLGPSNLKTQGIWIKGSGRGVTSLNYLPAASAPMFTNDHGLDVKFSDMTVIGQDIGSDFCWMQEQAGQSNIQDFTFVDVEWQGQWNNLFRLTGSNNNSEWKFDRCTVNVTLNGSWIYTPPKIASTFTNGSSSILATNTAEQVCVGDTGFFDASISPIVANTKYYVVSASTSAFQVAATSGGVPISLGANGSANFQTASDQFLNFWFAKCKFNTGTSVGQWLTLNFGGSVKIRDCDVSGHAPASVSYLFNLFGNNHAQSVQDLDVQGLRIEHTSTNSRTIQSQWGNGNILFTNLDESSQAGSWPITNAYAAYSITNNQGPVIAYRNCMLLGVHNYSNSANNYNYQNEVIYNGCTLMENPSAANFITITSAGNSGGVTRVNFVRCRNTQNAGSVGYHEIVDTDINWNKAVLGQTDAKVVALVSANSDFPFNGGSVTFRLPLNAMITRIRYWNPGGSGAGGAYNYSIQTTEGSPTVLLTISGTNASTPVPAASMVTSTPNFVMTTDQQRTIQIVDTQPRGSIFTGMYCILDYIG